MHWTDEQKRAYVIADNQLTLNAEWNDDLLKNEIEALKNLNFDVSLLGFPDNNEGDIFLKTSGEELVYAEVYEISVECSDEEDQQKVFKIMTDKGYKCRVLSM